MSEHDTPRPGLGSMPHEGGTAFRVWAPQRRRRRGDRQLHRLVATTATRCEAEDNGHWYADVEGAGPGDEYQFVIHNGDQRLMRIDPRARASRTRSGNAVVYDRDAFDWQRRRLRDARRTTSSSSTRPHIGSFVGQEGDAGDLEGSRRQARLPAELGINAIELMPVTEFAGDYSWGYNPRNPSPSRAPTAAPTRSRASSRRPTGTASRSSSTSSQPLRPERPLPVAVRRLERGRQGRDLLLQRRALARTPWGDTRPDYGREEVRAYLHDNALMWLEELPPRRAAFRRDPLRPHHRRSRHR